MPGGGIVSVPLETSAASGSGGRGGGAERVTSPSSSIDSSGGQLLQGLPAPPPPASASGDASSVGGASDLLQTAPPHAGEPVTHFNLDQLLEIVQSFQLDATLAGNEEAPHLNLASAEGAVANIIKVKKEKEKRCVIFYGRAACCTYHCTPFNLGLLDANA